MKKFIGRQAEINVLEESYNSLESGFIPIYGRRRVGKSELILHCTADRPSLYFLGKQAPAALQIREFLREAARAFDQPLLAELNVSDWKTALTRVLDQAPRDRKIILALDEFQWLAKSSPEMPSVLQELWDLLWRDNGKILLILCGSYLGFMEKEVLGQKSPLFGRRTAQIFLQPFSYQESAHFFPDWSLEDCARAYFICGGIPFYLQMFDPQLSIAQNIQQNILNEFAPMYSEPEFLLREELKELEKYYGILMALSAGSLTGSHMAKLSGIPEKSLYYYLQTLTGLRYVSRKYPLTGKKPSARNVRFEVTDPLLRFWFRFVYPNKTYISQISPSQAYQTLIAPSLTGYFGFCFEQLCMEALPFLYRLEDVSVPFDVGAYWDKNVQIDVVGFRHDKRIDLGECKWGTVTSLPGLVNELSGKIAKYPNPENITLQGRLFTRQPVDASKLPPNIRAHCLEELYDR